MRILEDYRKNKGNSKGRLIVILWRIFSYGYRLWLFKSLSKLLNFIFIDILFGIEIPLSVEIQGGFQIYHGRGVVIHSEAIIGKNFVIRQGCTVGKFYRNGSAPIIGADVSMGAYSMILGGVIVSDKKNIFPGRIVHE